MMMHTALIISKPFAGIVVVVLLVLSTASGFNTGNGHVICPKSHISSKLNEHISNEDNGSKSISEYNRRDAMKQVCGHTAAALITASSTIFTNPSPSNANDIEGVVNVPQSTSPPTFTSQMEGGKSVTVFKTKSGLQYIDLAEGYGPQPKYGNFVSIAYKAFVKLPDAQGQKYDLDEFDSEKQYLVKHGNGRNVPGLDEGLHTMKVGGKRRIIIPPKLGYVTFGLGPIPSGPYGRWKLNHLIDRMVELKGGNLIFDIEMKSILEDEADQGYYEDESLSPDDFNTLRQNIESSQMQNLEDKKQLGA